jgi:Spy/CpxP family protein refolding chaperone
MNRRIVTPAILPALLLLLAVPAGAQEAEQDSAEVRQAPRGMMHRGMMHRGMMHRGMGQMGQPGGAGMGAMMGAGHVGPRLLIGLKDELELSDEQVARLEGVRESHHALMTGLREQLVKQHEALREARGADDYDAMDAAIEEAGRLRTQMTRSHIDVERQTLAVLDDDQRARLDTWQEGVRLFRRQGMQMRRHMGEGDGPGGQMHRRRHRPPQNQ